MGPHVDKLHAHWQLTEDPYESRLLFWLERASTSRAKKRHPRAVNPDEISERVDPNGVFAAQFESVRFDLQLPSLTSPLAVNDDPSDSELRPWRIPALAVLPAAGAALLLKLMEAHSTGSLRFELAPSVRYWRRALELALNLIARQEVLPALVDHQARWQLRVDAQRSTFDAIAEAMPAVCRAETDDPADAVNPRTLLDSYLQTTTDALLRQRLEPPKKLPRTTVGRFLHHLTGEPRVQLADAQLRHLMDQQAAWRRNLQGTGLGAVRVGLRLEAPAEEDGSWKLAYLLQSTSDPSLQLPARVVWGDERRLQSLEPFGVTAAGAREEMLAGLGYAARLSEPVRLSLNAAAPAEAELTREQAFEFLNEAAPLLQESGFEVFVPAWWTNRGSNLTARVQATADEDGGVGKGLLSLDRLISYRWELSIGNAVIDADAFNALVKLKAPLVQVRGEWIGLDEDQLERARRFFEQPQAVAPGLLGALQLAATVGGEVGGEVGGVQLEEFEADGELAKLLQRLSGSERLKPVPAPASLHAELRPYQETGLSWLAFLEELGLGACLADDMGLGKTVQTLALLEHLRTEGRLNGPVLLVCPTSVVSNWHAEATKFAPELRLLSHHGAERLSGAKFKKTLKKHDLVLTSYGLARREVSVLSKVRWRGVILDEAQNIKNPHAAGSRALFSLPADFRLALTGTPVENRLTELWSIMRFLNPGHLGSLAEFRRSFARPIEQGGNEVATATLKRLIQPFILRRSKRDPQVISDLPDKLERQHDCFLSPEQASLYQSVVGEGMDQVEGSEGIARDGLVLAMLTKLKQVCNHPAHFLKERDLGPPGRSGKLERFAELFEEALEAGDRSLIFTQFRAMGDLLNRYLQQELGLDTLYLHGGTPAKKRQEMVERFQSEAGPPVFILSLKAGGTGLNLTRANHVFHFDRWWNPAVEQQATDRAFRIGQTRNVQVHTLLATGTLEERISELMRRKQELADSVVGGDGGTAWLTRLDTISLRELVTLGRSGTP